MRAQPFFVSVSQIDGPSALFGRGKSRVIDRKCVVAIARVERSRPNVALPVQINGYRSADFVEVGAVGITLFV